MTNPDMRTHYDRRDQTTNPFVRLADGDNDTRDVPPVLDVLELLAEQGITGTDASSAVRSFMSGLSADTVRVSDVLFTKIESLISERDRLRAMVAALEEELAQRPEPEKLTRLTVVHHKGGEGMVFERYGVEITLDAQDDGRTLKVFVNDRDNGDGSEPWTTPWDDGAVRRSMQAVHQLLQARDAADELSRETGAGTYQPKAGA